MATSNTYNFGSSSFDTLLRSSFQMCGMDESKISGDQAQLAIQSANLILSDMANRGNNLWLSQTLMMPIIPGQQTYLLPKQVTYIKELQAVQLAVAQTSTGFIGNTNKATSSITIDYGLGQFVSIDYAAYTPSINNQIVSLDLQYSFDAVNWQSAFSQPWTPTTTTVATAYPTALPTYFVPTAPVGARAWRILNTGITDISGGTLTLNTQSNSRLLVSLSENDFYSIPMPTQQPTSVSSYYLDRQIQPTINLWPIPDNTYQAFVYKAMTTAQDAVYLINQGQLPQRFLRAFVYEWAAELALQFAIDRYPTLSELAKQMYDRAATEDRERVPLRITPNFVSYT